MSSKYTVAKEGCVPQPLSQTPSFGTSLEYIKDFKSRFGYTVLKHDDPNELVVVLSNINVSIANSLRRILLSSLPTMAIETVYVDQNTSITHDEVLSHR